MIKAENLSVGIGVTTILQAINWRVKRGEHWIITGQNGAGKSTLARSLVGKTRKMKGSLRFPFLGAQPDFDRKKRAIALVSFTDTSKLFRSANIQHYYQALLSNIQLIKTKYIAANSEEKWADYELGEQQGTRVQVFAGEKQLEDFMAGRFAFDQQAQTGTSYLRLTNGKEVYAVDGFQTLTLGQGFNSYRDRTISNFAPNVTFNELTLQQIDTAFTFSKTSGTWMYGDQVLDSMNVEIYLEQFMNLKGDTFADDFDEIQAPSFRIGGLSLGGTAMTDHFSIEIYQDTTRINPFVFRSSQNPEAWFDSDSTGLFRKLVRDLPDFLPSQE